LDLRRPTSKGREGQERRAREGRMKGRKGENGGEGIYFKGRRGREKKGGECWPPNLKTKLSPWSLLITPFPVAYS